VDINGNRVPDGPAVVHSKNDGRTETTEITQSVNGRTVPLERVDERVIRDDSSGRVVERIIRRYDQTGGAMTPGKEIIEEQKRPDGSSTKQVTSYRGDINGGMQVIEKSVTQVQSSGPTENADRYPEAHRQWIARNGGKAEHGQGEAALRLHRGQDHLPPGWQWWIPRFGA
jgi:hypothetical protein